MSAAAIALHFAGFFTYALKDIGGYFYLIVFAFMFLSVIVQSRIARGRGSSRRYMAPSDAADRRAFFKYVNTPILIFTILVGFYVVVNSLLTISYLEGGNPAVIDGSYYLVSHGDIIRQIDFDYFQKSLLVENRQITSLSMLISLGCSTYCSFHAREASAKNAAK